MYVYSVDLQVSLLFLLLTESQKFILSLLRQVYPSVSRKRVWVGGGAQSLVNIV